MSTLYHDALGATCDIMNPKVEDIDLRAMAIRLCGVARYNNSPLQKIFVGHHSLIVEQLLPHRLKPYGLIHDFHEDKLSDLNRPTKNALKRATEAHIGQRLPDFDPFAALEKQWDLVIHQAAGLPWPLSEKDQAKIKWADDTALATEVRDLFEKPERFTGLPKPARFPVKPMSEREAADKLVARLMQHGLIPSEQLPEPIATPRGHNFVASKRAFS